MLQNLSIDGFATKPETLAQLQNCASDRRLGKNRMAVRHGGLNAAIAHYANASTPKVIIIEDDHLDQLDQLADVCDPGTRVIIIGGINDILFYRSLMERGVADYLLSPLSASQIIDTLARLFADPNAAPKGRVIAFWGARGGTGSSCLAQNMAWSLGRTLQSPILYIDCDIPFGTSQLALNLDARQTIADIMDNQERLDQVLVDRSLLNCGDYLRVLAAPGDLRTKDNITPEAMQRLVDIASRMAPIVVLDVPHLWTEWTQHVLASASDVIVTAWPDFTSLRNIKNMLETAEVPFKLVLNGMDAFKRTQLTASDFETTLSVKPALSIPFDPLLFGEAANTGQIAIQSAPLHKTSKVLSAFAETLSGKTSRKSSLQMGQTLLKWLGR